MGQRVPDPTAAIEEQGVLEGDEAIIPKLEEWFTESKQFMDPQRERWRRNEALYYNEIQLSLPTKHTQLKYALPLAVIETELPIISDFMPTFDVQPREQDDVQYADMVQRRKGQLESQTRLKKHLLYTVKDSLIYSDGIVCILPELKGDRFVGLDIRVADLFTWFPSPGSISLDLRKCRYQIFATPMHVDEVERQYGTRVEPEGFLDDYRSFHLVEQGTDNSQALKMALVKECYRMDPDEERYPFGRVTVWANGKILKDGPLWEGLPADAEYTPPMPFFKISNYGTAHSLFGIGETYLVRTQAKCLNEVMSALAETVKKTGNPVRKVLRSWLSQAKRAIQGHAGEEVVVDNPMDVTWETPPQVPASTFQFIDLMLRLTDVVTGVHDVMEGRKPAGITAATAILALQEAAQARVRFKIAHEISGWVEEIGRFVLWILQTYDRETRTIRQITEQGEHEFIPYDGEAVSKGKFDVEVVAGTRAPTGRIADEERAKEKFSMGIYGIEEYVNASAEPNKRQVIESWYRRQGLDQAMQRQTELNQAMEQFVPMVEMALQAPEAFAGSPEEEQAADMLKQYPELLQTGEFDALPAAIKERMLMVFLGNENAGIE